MIEKERQGTYHCTSQGTLSWADLAEAIFERIDEDITVQRIPTSAYPTEAARPFYSKLNTRKIEQIEGIQIENWQTELTRLLEKLAN
jgi:dTDP-4-dehydrorhamnose reductase